MRLLLLATVVLLWSTAARGQSQNSHAGHRMHAMPDTSATHQDHAAHLGRHALPAFLGPCLRNRGASATSWVPDAAPHEGAHATRGVRSLMAHGFAMAVGDKQGGPRGDEKFFGAGMLMGMAARPVGPGRLGLRTMVSIDPAGDAPSGGMLYLRAMLR